MSYDCTLPNKVIELIAATFAGMNEKYRADAGWSALYVHRDARKKQWFVTDNFETTRLSTFIYEYEKDQWTKRMDWGKSSDPVVDSQISHEEAVKAASKWFSECEQVRR